MLLRELYEASSKTAVLAFGRMNPPTIGHKKLADKVASLPGDPYIFLSQSQKPKTDPLDFSTKVKFAQSFFPNVTVGDSSVKTIIQALQKLESMGYTDIVYVAGSDRIGDFTTLINKYNGTEYNFDSVNVVNAGERDPDADGAEGMSASKMRAAAASGNLEAFAQGVPDNKLAKTMYDAVRNGMGVRDQEPVPEAVAVEPDPKGYDKVKLTMPQNTLVIDTASDLDWYKIGKNIANLDQSNPHEYGQGDSDVVVTSASPEEMQKLMKQLDRLGLQYKAIGGTHSQPEIHATENFADGKKPGRKGLAKRSGVNTKASVSSLRKTAKNSSGEKQRMAHWQANMKAGRAKAKK